MPSVLEHLGQAELNEAAFRYLTLASPRFLSWQVTTLLYATLHLVDAYLHATGVTVPDPHPRSHIRTALGLPL